MKVLILTGNFGMGHNSAANAIAERISGEFEGAGIYVEDLFTHAFNSSGYDALFRLMVKQGKYLYNYVYRRTEDSEALKKLPFNKNLKRSLEELIKSSGADIIISTLWSCSKVVSDYKRSAGSAIPLITCITDVSSHSEWIQPDTDFYLVAAPEIKDELMEKGVEGRRIIVSGVPVRSVFGQTGTAREQPRDKRLLIMGGGLGLLPRAKSFYEQIDRLCGVKTTILTGNNTGLYKSLRGRYENVEVLPYTNDVPVYMKSADLLISKPGGITLFEALSAGLPLLSFPPFLQQEIRNGAFILENGLGDMLPNTPRLWTQKIQDVLNDSRKIASMKANIRAFKNSLDEDALLSLVRQLEMQCA